MIHFEPIQGELPEDRSRRLFNPDARDKLEVLITRLESVEDSHEAVHIAHAVGDTLDISHHGVRPPRGVFDYASIENLRQFALRGLARLYVVPSKKHARRAERRVLALVLALQERETFLRYPELATKRHGS